MKTINKRFVSLFLAILLMLAVTIPAMAVNDESKEPTRASAYITSCYAQVTRIGNSVDVYFTITGTGLMTSIGATGIMIFNNHGYCVALLDASNTAGLMGTNRYFYSNTVTWNGAVSGDQYYAIVGFKAENNSGYDTTSYMTTY